MGQAGTSLRGGFCLLYYLSWKKAWADCLRALHAAGLPRNQTSLCKQRLNVCQGARQAVIVKDQETISDFKERWIKPLVCLWYWFRRWYGESV